MSTTTAIKQNADPAAVVTTQNPNVVKATLKEHGAVIIRTPATVRDFEALSDALITPMVHHSTSTHVERDVVNAEGTTSTVNKGMDYIPLHREGSYAPGCPDLLLLYCVRPADAGGQTQLCDGVDLLNALPAVTKKFVEDAILKWSWRATPERWMATLGVNSKDAALKRLSLMKTRLPSWENLEVEFDGDDLKGVFQTLCVIPTKWGRKRSFCNSLLIYHYRQATEFYPKHHYLPAMGDGSPFPYDMLAEISALALKRTHNTFWQPNDILVFNNSRFMHGRTAFTDPQRQILVRMGHIKAEQ
jgi:alpha-ketoglutarate-dependent taurine dioxygenase